MFGFLFNPNGRVTRKGIWLGFLLPVLALTFGLSYLAGNVTEIAGLGLLVLILFYLWPSIAVPVKRLHDLNLSGWILLVFIALNIIFFIVLISPFFAQLDWAAIMEASENGTEYEPDEAELVAKMEIAAQSMTVKAGLAGLGLTALIQFVLLYLWPGKKGDNKYGADPRG